MTEEMAERQLASVLEGGGWTIERQVRLGGRRVDIVAERNGVRLAIEVKLRDWKRGAAQAYLSSLFFDGSLVALPANKRRRIDFEFLRVLDVGVIEFDATGWRTLLAPNTEAARSGLEGSGRAG